jgi:hypothetical protein
MGAGSSTQESSTPGQTNILQQKPTTVEDVVRWYLDTHTQEVMRDTCFEMNIYQFKDKRFDEAKFKQSLTECFEAFLKNHEISKQMLKDVYKTNS